MHHDSRVYIEIRYDGNTADVVVVGFRDRGLEGTETVSHEMSMQSPTLTGNTMKEVREALHGVLDGLIGVV